MVLAVAGERAGAVVQAAGLVAAGTGDDGGIKIDEMRVGRAMWVVTRHAGCHADMFSMAGPGGVEKVMAFEAERGISGV